MNLLSEISNVCFLHRSDEMMVPDIISFHHVEETSITPIYRTLFKKEELPNEYFIKYRGQEYEVNIDCYLPNPPIKISLAKEASC
jgi:hypothetical protein